MIRSAALFLFLAPFMALAQTPEPENPAEAVAEVYGEALEAIPDEDVSWIALRSVFGPELWDGAAGLLPDAMLAATLPGAAADRSRLAGLPDLDMAPAPGAELAIADVLGGITRLITLAGTALLAAFGAMMAYKAVSAYRKGGTFELAGASAFRLLAGFGFLTPVGQQGYCVAQAVVMLAAQMGIGMANAAWDLAAAPLVGLARHEAAAEEAALEMLEIDAEAAAAAAVATGLCVGLTSRGFYLRGSDRDWTGDRQHSRRCGGIEDPGRAEDRLAGLARAYGPAGERARELIARIRARRVEALSGLREAVTDAVIDEDSWFSGVSAQAEPLAVWAAASQPDPLRLDAVETHYIGHGLVEVYRTPAETQAAWWLLAELIGERGAGACLREWAGTDSAGAPLAPMFREAIRVDAFGTDPELRPNPRARWPFQHLRGALAGAAGTECTADTASPFWRAVRALRPVDEAAAAEALGPLIQDLYGEQLGPLIGGGPEGRRGWLMAGAVYWHLQQARGVNRTLRAMVEPSVARPDFDMDMDATRRCRDGESSCPHLHAWHAGHLVGRAAAQAARAQKGAVAAAIGTPPAGPPPAAPPLAYAGLDPDGDSVEAAANPDAGPLLARWLVGELRAAGADGAPLTRLMSTGHKLTGTGLAMAGGGGLLSFAPGFIGDMGGGLKSAGFVLLAAGLALAVWIPLLPLIAWIASIWAWLVSVILGVLAAPLWALTHAVPGGAEALSHHARRGYQLLLFTAARPVFLVAGLLVAMLVAGLICKLAAVMFSVALGGYSAATLTEGASPALHWVLVSCAALVIYAFILWLVTKTFTLCHELPDRVFEWVGTHGPSLGDSEMLQAGRAFVGGLVMRIPQSLPKMRGAGQRLLAPAPPKEKQSGGAGGPGSPAAFPGMKPGRTPY